MTINLREKGATLTWGLGPSSDLGSEIAALAAAAVVVVVVVAGAPGGDHPQMVAVAGPMVVVVVVAAGPMVVVVAGLEDWRTSGRRGPGSSPPRPRLWSSGASREALK
jgi:hypothetical protein